MTVECGKGLLGKEARGLLGRRFSEKDNIFKTLETGRKALWLPDSGNTSSSGVLTWKEAVPTENLPVSEAINIDRNLELRE